MVRVGPNVELPFGGQQIRDGVFNPNERELAILDRELIELASLADDLKSLR
jgi:hypothetical protein